MGELDYQMALLLQHRFEQEYKSNRNEVKSDYELAKALQEQFEQEEAVERPSTSLVYSPPKGLNSSKSLTDPSWELVDPTPDIHSLFMAFSQRYFWNKLLAVCVSWSKRMTTCAGICSYQGRGGMCSITLSEPLLKLRPRKDLVETLLHEMIHAYLFVTNNNRDRDGHGPEFHKHMYRINNEAGTNITVYHNFHDEVRLYQQHWWRCNGPCQFRKPYFGMVRRATNRAPGPNDRWWGEHSRNCNGTFIKVKEPEKKKKTESKKTETSTSGKNADIRNFLPVVKGAAAAVGNSSTSTDLVTKSTGNITPSTSTGNVLGTSSSSSKTKSFKDLVTKNNENANPSTSNIKGFNDLGTKVRGKFNSTSTIVVTKNTKTSETFFQPTVFNGETPKEKTKTGRSNSCTDEFLEVRNHWAKKFNNANNNNKRPTSSSLEDISNKNKIPKTDSSLTPNDDAECPVCGKKILMANLNSHLDACLNTDAAVAAEVVDLTQVEVAKECPLCNRQVPSSSFDGHVEKCIMKIYNDVEENFEGKSSRKEETTREEIPCLACGKQIFKDDLNSHLDDCMNDIFKVKMDDDKGDEDEGGEKEDNNKYNCPYCMKLLNEVDMKEHLDVCLSAVGECDVITSFMDDIF